MNLSPLIDLTSTAVSGSSFKWVHGEFPCLPPGFNGSCSIASFTPTILWKKQPFLFSLPCVNFLLCYICRELQAFIAEYSVLQYYVSQHKKCLLRAIKTTNGHSSWNVAFKKNSPWKNIVSKKILEYKEKGLFDNIMKKWIQTKCIGESAVHLTSQKYTIAHFSGLIVLLSCASIFSIIVLLFECWISKRIKSSSGYSLERR